MEGGGFDGGGGYNCSSFLCVKNDVMTRGKHTHAGKKTGKKTGGTIKLQHTSSDCTLLSKTDSDPYVCVFVEEGGGG